MCIYIYIHIISYIYIWSRPPSLHPPHGLGGEGVARLWGSMIPIVFRSMSPVKYGVAKLGPRFGIQRSTSFNMFHPRNDRSFNMFHPRNDRW